MTALSCVKSECTHDTQIKTKTGLQTFDCVRMESCLQPGIESTVELDAEAIGLVNIL